MKQAIGILLLAFGVVILSPVISPHSLLGEVTSSGLIILFHLLGVLLCLTGAFWVFRGK